MENVAAASTVNSMASAHIGAFILQVGIICVNVFFTF